MTAVAETAGNPLQASFESLQVAIERSDAVLAISSPGMSTVNGEKRDELPTQLNLTDVAGILSDHYETLRASSRQQAEYIGVRLRQVSDDGDDQTRADELRSRQADHLRAQAQAGRMSNIITKFLGGESLTEQERMEVTTRVAELTADLPKSQEHKRQVYLGAAQEELAVQFQARGETDEAYGRAAACEADGTRQVRSLEAERDAEIAAIVDRFGAKMSGHLEALEGTLAHVGAMLETDNLTAGLQHVDENIITDLQQFFMKKRPQYIMTGNARQVALERSRDSEVDKVTRTYQKSIDAAFQTAQRQAKQIRAEADKHKEELLREAAERQQRTKSEADRAESMLILELSFFRAMQQLGVDVGPGNIAVAPAPIPPKVAPRMRRPEPQQSEDSSVLGRLGSASMHFVRQRIANGAQRYAVRDDSDSAPVVARRDEADASPRQPWSRRRVSLIAGALALGVALPVMLERGSSTHEQSVTQLADNASQLPNWPDFPESIKAWHDETDKVLRDPRIASGLPHNYLLGDGTKENPGHGAFLYVMQIMSSQGNPEYQTGLLPITQADAKNLTEQMQLRPGTNDAENGMNSLLMNARKANEAMSDVLEAHPGLDQSDPGEFYGLVLKQWNIKAYQDTNFISAFTALCLDWPKKSSPQFASFLKNQAWVTNFANAAKVDEKQGILSASEKSR